MEENRYRYKLKKSEQNQLYEAALQKAKHYQAKILNPCNFIILLYSKINQVQFILKVTSIFSCCHYDPKKLQEKTGSKS